MMQFKQFPTAMVTKAWGADIYGGAKGLKRVAGLVELMVSSTIFGLAANYLTSLTKGLLGFALPVLVIGLYSSIESGGSLVSRNRWLFNRKSLLAIPL